MQRKDREVTERADIADILARAPVIRLGINGSPYPYVVPVNFGYEEKDGELRIYIHGAKIGRKHDLLAADPHVCVEADHFYGYEETAAGGLSCGYESIIGLGKAHIAEGEEAVHGMNLICTHCGYDGYEFDTHGLTFMRIYKIILTTVTGKRRALEK